MKVIISLLFLLGSVTALGSEFFPFNKVKMENQIQELDDLKEDLEEMTDELIKTHFPDLVDQKISIKFSKSERYLLRTAFRPQDVFKKSSKRKYSIIFSKNYLDILPTREALKAVLVHELHHILDYSQKSGWELLKFVMNYVSGPKKFVPEYERFTDSKTLAMGYDSGMFQYRVWQQRYMPEKIREQKIDNYYSPDEVLLGLWDYPETREPSIMERIWEDSNDT